MLGETHRSLTREVGRLAFPPILATIADGIALNAALPDDMQDIVVGRFGTKVLGHKTGALDHFCVMTDMQGLFRGYNFQLDASLCKTLRKLDPRFGDVAVEPAQWVQVVGKDLALQHPLSRLVVDLAGHATLDADDMTFPTAAIMAEWVWKAIQGGPGAHIDEYAFLRAVGCICHFIQDACVTHHARGWMGAGHARLERGTDKSWQDPTLRATLLTPPLPFAPSRFDPQCPGFPSSAPLTPRAIVEDAAGMSWAAGGTGATPSAVLTRGVLYTAHFLRWVVLPLMTGGAGS